MSSLRRLALDHASLRQSELPPNYLFPSNEDSAILPDDLTQLTVLLTGAQGTPYAQGLWQLHLRMPTDYPKNPPKATFKTRMWHPNVEESTGAVCLETLKRDWDPKLTLRDVLLTISCLLIHPNPDSALNSAAGSLLQDDYEAFAEQARLMAFIHARIPATLKQAVDAARRRGDEIELGGAVEQSAEHPESRSIPRAAATPIQKKLASQHSRHSPIPLPRIPVAINNEELSEDEEEHDSSKENDPSQSPSPVVQSPRSPRKNVLGKRPLSELPTPTDAEDGMTESEKNIVVNQSGHKETIIPSGSMKKSRVAATAGDVNVHSEFSEKTCDGSSCMKNIRTDAEKEKENPVRKVDGKSSDQIKIVVRATVRPTLRKVSNMGMSKSKSQPRVGIRRL